MSRKPGFSGIFESKDLFCGERVRETKGCKASCKTLVPMRKIGASGGKGSGASVEVGRSGDVGGVFGGEHGKRVAKEQWEVKGEE